MHVAARTPKRHITSDILVTYGVGIQPQTPQERHAQENFFKTITTPGASAGAVSDMPLNASLEQITHTHTHTYTHVHT